MTLLVPFDGSALAETALKRAREFASYRDEAVVALTVVPEDESFAAERGWIEPGEPYDPEEICTEFELRVKTIDDDVTFRCEHPTPSEHPTATTIDNVTHTIREVAADLDVSVIFIGSENAGRVSTPVPSVGDPLSTDAKYDVYIVRRTE
ncbi:universal stress protein [Haloplanus aerogenes]|uniref:Universal stress protein n=1 Tax=Haloplanus aerogenes TaxID=660522 RepID=A0A3G8QPZ4_9EURY|nr:universal stress protein [Haloplanus aerogenes]AZH24526.1 universal stress protein [Haloplanus aerogenes]